MAHPVCNYCGKPMPRFANHDALVACGHHIPSRYGYQGNGIFCSLHCGYRYGLSMAKAVGGAKPHQGD